MEIIKDLYDRKIISSLFLSWFDDMKLALKDEEYQDAKINYKCLCAYLLSLDEHCIISFKEYVFVRHYIDEVYMEGF